MEQMKKMLKRYDEWCHSMGLTPEQKRGCVPIKKDHFFEQTEKADKKKNQ